MNWTKDTRPPEPPKPRVEFVRFSAKVGDYALQFERSEHSDNVTIHGNGSHVSIWSWDLPEVRKMTADESRDAMLAMLIPKASELLDALRSESDEPAEAQSRFRGAAEEVAMQPRDFTNGR
jgi:hypothetical protein